MPPNLRKTLSSREELDATQKKAFKNWLKDKLKGSGYEVADLEKDLEDGVVLIKLLETLVPGSKMPGR